MEIVFIRTATGRLFYDSILLLLLLLWLYTLLLGLDRFSVS
jgi:hypothetical protein